MGPVYLVDLSRTQRHLALMIHPGHEVLASKENEQLIHGLIDTIELRPEHSDRQGEVKVCGATCKK